MQTLPSYSSSTNSEAKQTEAIIMRVLTSYVRIVCDYPGPSASTGEQVPVSDLLWLGLVWSCFVFCLLFLLYSGTPVICTPVLTEGTDYPSQKTVLILLYYL